MVTPSHFVQTAFDENSGNEHTLIGNLLLDDDDDVVIDRRP